MAGRRAKKRVSPLALVVMVLIVVVIALGAGLYYARHSKTSKEMDKDSYYGLSSSDQAALVVDDKVLDTTGIVKDGRVYIDYDTVADYLNSSFYLDAESGKVLLTMPDGTHSWDPEDGTGDVITENGSTWIAADVVKAYSDIDLTEYEDPYRVVARTSWDNLTAETVATDDEVRFRGGPKAEILTYVKAGDTVVLTGNAGDWCEVSTPDGYVGYIEKKNLETAPSGTISHTADQKFVFDKVSVDYRINLSWQYTDADDGTGELQTLAGNAAGLNTISPTWFSFSSAAGDLRSLASVDYVNAAHAMGLKVWGCLQDVTGGQFSAASILAGQTARTHVIDQLLSAAKATAMDGINIDIETVTEESVPQYLQFLRELCLAAHAEGLVVSVDNYVPAYTSYLNRKEQAKYVDYLVIMGYDEHTAASDEAGSVASLPFVEQGITDTLSEVPASQVVNAIPFYCRAWTKTAGTDTLDSEALGMADAQNWAAAHGISLVWDQKDGQYTGSADDGGVTCSIWLEDEKSVGEKMKLIQKYDLAGVASWRLGLERDDVWETIAEYLK